MTIRLFLILALAAMPLSGGVEDHPDVQGAIRLFSGWLEGQMAYRGLPGVVVGVVHDQELVWSRGFGFANTAARTPVTASTRFRMASHSKLFTATAIMQLRDQGKLRLDDPVSRYLPWFRIQPASPDDPPITIEELLTHASGLPREAGPHWTNYDFPEPPSVQNYVSEHAAIYPPDVRWKYSNLAFALAGQIVESVSGEKFNDYVDRHIFRPLGMSASSIDRPDDAMAVGYGRRMPDGSRKVLPFIDSKGLSAATGVTSTVEDMARFVSLQFRKGSPGGAQILSTGALREMHRVRVMENDWTRGNAIGFAVNRVRDKIFVGHGGSYPGYKTHTLIDLPGKVGVIVLANGDDSNPADIANQLMMIVGQPLVRVATPAPTAVTWDPSWRRFAGLYRSVGGDTLVVELNQSLVGLDPLSSNPAVQNRLIPLGGGLFRLEADAGGGAVGETVRFHEVGGRVVRMYVGESYSERVP